MLTGTASLEQTMLGQPEPVAMSLGNMAVYAFCGKLLYSCTALSGQYPQFTQAP